MIPSVFPRHMVMAAAVALGVGAFNTAHAGILWEYALDLGTIEVPIDQPVGREIYDSGLIIPSDPNSAGMGGCNDAGFGWHKVCRAESDFFQAPLASYGSGWFRTSIPGIAMQVMTYFPQYDLIKYIPYPQEPIFYPSGQAGMGVMPLFQVKLRTYGEGVREPVDLPSGLRLTHVYALDPASGWVIRVGKGRIVPVYPPDPPL